MRDSLSHRVRPRGANAITVLSSQDGAQLVRKWLKQALASERLAPSQRSKAGPVSAGELLGLLDDLLAHPGACADVLFVFNCCCCFMPASAAGRRRRQTPRRCEGTRWVRRGSGGASAVSFC